MSDEWNPNDPDATRVLYDLSQWTFDQQADLASELAEADVPHTWDGAELVVPETHEALADSTITRVEQRLGIVYDGGDTDEADDEIERIPLPPPVEIPEGAATTEYELDDWEDDERQLLTRALNRQQIPHRWEDDVLLVPTDRETVAEGLMDLIEAGTFTPHDEDIDELDDETARLPFETLTTFFLAGERLQRNPLDADGLEQLLIAVDVAEPTRPPYGVDLRLWQRTCELADELAGALVDDDVPDEDAAISVASELHDLLRPYI